MDANNLGPAANKNDRRVVEAPLSSRFIRMKPAFHPNLLRGTLLASLVCIVSVKGDVFYAALSPLGTASATGSVAVFLHSTDGHVGYTGMVHDVEPSLTDALCSAPNGCGAHIHAGKSCESVETQVRQWSFPPGHRFRGLLI
jgi:hypothetical protein